MMRFLFFLSNTPNQKQQMDKKKKCLKRHHRETREGWRRLIIRVKSCLKGEKSQSLSRLDGKQVWGLDFIRGRDPSGFLRKPANSCLETNAGRPETHSYHFTLQTFDLCSTGKVTRQQAVFIDSKKISKANLWSWSVFAPWRETAGEKYLIVCVPTMKSADNSCPPDLWNETTPFAFAARPQCTKLIF